MANDIYNLTRYNLSAASDIFVDTSCDYVIEIYGVAGIAVFYDIDVELFKVNILGRAAASRYYNVVPSLFNVALFGTAVSGLIAYESPEFNITLRANAHVGAIINVAPNSITADFRASAHVGAIVNVSPTPLLGVIQGNAHVGAICYLTTSYEFWYWTIINGVATIESITRQNNLFDVSIPPGGEIRIDSQFFTATQNNDNILHLLETNYFVKMNRNVKTIEITNINGMPMIIELIYTERWL